MLDDKLGLVAYLWNYTSGFNESPMTNSGGKVFTAKLTGKTAGSVIQVACKFAYSGGMSVTKTFSYTVGDACVPTSLGNSALESQCFYPNPVTTNLNLQLASDENRVTLFNAMGEMVLDREASAVDVIDMSSFTPGIYFIKIENSTGIKTGKIIKR